jgi:hypothetical protein
MYYLNMMKNYVITFYMFLYIYVSVMGYCIKHQCFMIFKYLPVIQNNQIHLIATYNKIN